MPLPHSMGGALHGRHVCTAASDRSDRSRDRSIESIGSIDSIIFRSFKIFGNSSWRRCGSNGPKIIKIRAILAIFWPFEDFCRKIRRPYRRRRKQWGGPGGAEAPPGPSVVGSIGSIIRSVRSIIVQPTSVDHSGNVWQRTFCPTPTMSFESRLCATTQLRPANGV